MPLAARTVTVVTMSEHPSPPCSWPQPVSTDLVTQVEARFPSGGVECAATVYRPPAAGEAVMAVVMITGMTLTRRDTVPLLARRLAAAGTVVVAFDCRCWGDSGGSPRGWFSVRRQREDLRAAVAFTRGLEGVDPDRVVLWGFSIGGGLALQLAAADHRLAGVVAVAAVTDGVAAMAAPAPLRLLAEMMGRGVVELIRRRPVIMMVAGRPGERAIFLGPEFLPGFQLATAGRAWVNEVSTSWLVTIAGFRPVRTVTRIKAPVLYQISENDSTPGAAASAKAVARTATAQVVRYPSHHFAVFTPDLLSTFADDTVDFLRRL